MQSETMRVNQSIDRCMYYRHIIVEYLLEEYNRMLTVIDLPA